MASLLQRCDQWLDQSLAAIHQQRTDQQVLEQAQSGLQKRTRGRNSERRCSSLDSTSITSYSKNISSVDYAHNKDLIDTPQTNVLTIVDQQSGELIYFRNFDGNVPDVSTVSHTLSELVMMNY